MTASLAAILGAGNAPLFISGAENEQWAFFKSTLDGDIYQKTAATGIDTVDPALDRLKWRSITFNRVLSLPAGTPLVGNAGYTTADWLVGATKTAVPAMAANTRTNVLSITGRGNLQIAGFLKNGSAAAGNTRVEIEADGLSVYDSTMAFGANSSWVNAGTSAPGYQVLAGTAYEHPDKFALKLDTLPFRRSLNVYVRNTLAITANTMYFGSAVKLEA